MKKTNVYILLVFAIIIWSCNKDDDCKDLNCFTPPSPFLFELVDKSSGENLFTTGFMSQDDIRVINLDDQSNVEYKFIAENDYNIIQINSIGWETQTVHYSVEISSESLFTFFVDAERLNGDCCSYTKYNEIEIDGSEFELNEQNGTYTIMVE